MLQHLNEEKLKVFKEKFHSQSPLFNSTPIVFSTRSQFQTGGGVFSEARTNKSAAEETPDSTIMFSNAELDQVSLCF
jgi:hypothetical protein